MRRILGSTGTRRSSRRPQALGVEQEQQRLASDVVQADMGDATGQMTPVAVGSGRDDEPIAQLGRKPVDQSVAQRGEAGDIGVAIGERLRQCGRERYSLGDPSRTNSAPAPTGPPIL